MLSTDLYVDEMMQVRARCPSVVVFLNGDRGLCTIRAISTLVERLLIVVPGNSEDWIRAELSGLAVYVEYLVYPVSQDEKIEFIRFLYSWSPDVGLVAGFSSIISEEIFSIPKLGMFNQHAGRLPEYRGGSPINWQIINDEPLLGATLIKIDSGIDTGPIFAREVFPLTDAMNVSDAHKCANDAFMRMSRRLICTISSGAIVHTAVQNNKNAAYWHQRSDADGFIDFSDLTARQIFNRVRALTHPYPGAWAYLGERKIRIFQVAVSDKCIRGQPGRVLRVDKEMVLVVCKDGAIRLIDYSPDDGGFIEIQSGAYLREFPVCI